MFVAHKFRKSTELFAIFCASFSLVDFGMDLIRLEFTLATVKSFGMLVLSVLLYLTIRKPELLNADVNNPVEAETANKAP